MTRRASVEASKAAADHGVDAILAVTPYYSKPSQRMLIAHFDAIADATELPVIVYNIPGRTACLVEVPTLVELARHPRIVATKDAVGDIGFSTRARQRLPEGFAIYSGDDSMTLPMMSVGGCGVISVASHLVGNQIKAMVSAAAAGISPKPPGYTTNSCLPLRGVSSNRIRYRSKEPWRHFGNQWARRVSLCFQPWMPQPPHWSRRFVRRKSL